MAKEPMELAKNWDPAKTPLPAYAQIKFDGVPLTFTRPADGGPVQALTRQNEVALSVPHLLEVAEAILLTPGASFTAECVISGYSFKDTSGVVRRQTPDEETKLIRAYVFDANIMNRPKDTYYTRITQFMNALNAVRTIGCQVFTVASVLVETVEQVEAEWDRLSTFAASKGVELEGMMLHHLAKPFQPGKRCWGMGRYKPQPTLDLLVVSFEEALANETEDGPPKGTPLGMVGRVNVLLRRRFETVVPRQLEEAGWLRTPDTHVWLRIVGVGPGKLSHDQRKALWDMYSNEDPHGMYAEIKYMPDPSYDALRQPTIQRLRTDKQEGDILEYS